MPGIAAGLAERGHEIGLDLRVAEDPVDFAREGIDLRVTYGGTEYPDLARHEILTDRVTALMAPGFLADGVDVGGPIESDGALSLPSEDRFRLG